jgi:hypothetical protein
MEFGLATPEDEPQLRSLLRSESMPGWVRLSYEREPDFFHAAATQGDYQVLVARQGPTIVGMGCRSWRRVYVNGVATTLGYLSGLRSLQGARNGAGLAKGYAFLKSLHQDGNVPGYLSTILEGNAPVKRLLTARRAGLPAYHDLGRFITFALPLGRWRPARAGQANLRIESVGRRDSQEVIAFLNEHGRQRQFFPVVQASDLESPLWCGCEEFLVAREPGGRMAGVLATWDQSAFKQTRILSYAPWMARSRPLWNAGLRLLRLPGLPAPGDILRLLNLSLVCVRGDRADTFGSLVNALHDRLQDRRFDFICGGFHERDPLLAALKLWLSLRYVSRLYWVCWEEDAHALAHLDPRQIPHLEVATL